MVGGCMLNKIMIKVYVKLHYMWYYIKHPSIYFKINKMRSNSSMKQDNGNWDEIDYTKAGTWIGIMLGTCFIWYSIFANGFFVTLMWLVVVSAVLALWLRLSGRV